MPSSEYSFGGAWTEEKLRILAAYLKAYTTALQGKPTPERPFTKAYIDAFAGSGRIRAQLRRRAGGLASAVPVRAGLSGDGSSLLDGSARRALDTQPPFDRYIFMEKSAKRCLELEKLKGEHPSLAARISIERGDANQLIRDLCSKDWRSHRAVMFLDPYGMQVEWATIEAMAGTRAIDLWVLFPHGMGVGRMLPQSGRMPESWRRRLDLVFGGRAWEDVLYRRSSAPDLFGAVAERVDRADVDEIGRYYNERLKAVFAVVAARPRVLRGPTGAPLYMLCFATANKRGAPIAIRLAEHLLRAGSR